MTRHRQAEIPCGAESSASARDQAAEMSWARMRCLKRWDKPRAGFGEHTCVETKGVDAEFLRVPAGLWA